MYIAPNSDIKVLSGVPLDNTYEHTLAWEQTPSARTTQANYFLSKVKYSFDKQYYTRVKRGWLKIQINPDDLWDCNYLMFRNTSFGDKWFYAFILSIEYINNETAQINYEIDVMQTWLRGALLDYNPEMCFVERQHTATDNFYEHLVPEDIANDGGEYFVDEQEVFDLQPLKIIIETSVQYNSQSQSWEAADSVFWNGIFGAVEMFIFNGDAGGTIDAGNFIKQLSEENNPDNIVSIRMASSKFMDAGSMPATTEQTVTLTKPVEGTYLGGANSRYVPRNKKCYTYPFSKINVAVLGGESKDYRWEDFTTEATRGQFAINGTLAWKPQVIAYPKNYKDIAKPVDDGVIYDNFPVCCWNGDAYKAWWAQNMSGAALLRQLQSPLIGAGIGVSQTVGGAANYADTQNALPIQAGVAGVAASGLTLLSRVLSAGHTQKHIANPVRGNPCGAILPYLREMKIRFTRQSYREETIRRYDRFFTKFGYAIGDVIAPAYLNRERWTYVKTVGCNLQTNINNEDSHKIASIYDNGITFWRNAGDIGNYELSNNPL